VAAVPGFIPLRLSLPARPYALALPAPRDAGRVLALGRTVDPRVWRFRVWRPGELQSEVLYRAL